MKTMNALSSQCFFQEDDFPLNTAVRGNKRAIKCSFHIVVKAKENPKQNS